MEITSSHRSHKHDTSHHERHIKRSRSSHSRSSSPRGRSKRRSRSVSPSNITRESRHKHSRRDSSNEKPKHKSKKKTKKRKEDKHHVETISVEELRNRVSEAKQKEKEKETILKPASAPLLSAQSQPPKRRVMVPQTRDEYTKEQSIIREVFDPLSGRTRLVKGSGEIIESIVSRDRHREINQIATRGDGNAYQARMSEFLRN